ncbi:hypothetical protein GCM10018793_35240 [Streptomyces sulfonofaciens]|uniref:Uncharacterized protein n=1 Tax=Streptomyces sulfonofaciens TaxID=68272 RepID=A0A919L1D6_9ACTN|nr:hypothetical protein [Streptomyces sulfonofaciens]GHH80323.1 hypothetical protein GCM10018793_35240 [Streptomyces sulfonofaciens]
MADDNAYFADPARLHSGIRQIESISSLAQAMLKDFVDEVNATKHWPGEDDSFAKQVLPRELKERQGSTDTIQSIADAVVGIADGTTANLRNITETQDGNMDAIRDSGRGAGHHGKH